PKRSNQAPPSIALSPPQHDRSGRSASKRLNFRQHSPVAQKDCGRDQRLRLGTAAAERNVLSQEVRGKMPAKTQRHRVSNVIPFPPRYPKAEAKLAAVYLAFHQCPSEWARALKLMYVVNDFLQTDAINPGAVIDRAFSETRARILAIDLVKESEL